MRANEFILERVTGTIDPRTGDVDMVNQRTGKMTQLRKDTRTDIDDEGTKVYRGGELRSYTTPKIGGFQATQTLRPDSTPGYQQVDYDTGGLSVSAKGSPETGYDQSVRYKMGDMDIGTTQKYSGQKSMDIGYQVRPGTKISATSKISKPGAKPVTKMSLTQSQFEDVQAAIREHVAKNVPFTECMFRAGSPAFTEFYRQVREVADKLNLDWQDQELLTTDIGECIMVEGELVPLDVPMIEEEVGKINFSSMAKIQNASTIGELVSALKPYESEMMEGIHDFAIDKGLGVVQQRKAYHGMFRFMSYGENMDDPISIKSIKRIPDIGNQTAPIIADYLDTEFALNLQGISEAEYQGRKVKLNSPKRGGSKKFYVYVKNPKTGRVKKISWGDTTGLSVKAKDRGAVRSFVARHKCKQANDKMTARYWSCRTPRYKALGVKGGQWW